MGIISKFKFIAELEKELFSLFGWTMRAFVNADDHAVFVQMMATCGNRLVKAPAKVEFNEPEIDIFFCHS